MRRKPKTWIGLGICLGILYVASASLYLGYRILPSTREGMTYLRLGEERLAADPTEASRQFAKAGASFEQASSLLRSSPFAAKLVAPLPPFRWYVSLIKATHALSEAGYAASSLSASFPSLIPDGGTDLNGLLAASTSRYGSWERDNDGSISQLLSYLGEANDGLTAIPPWIAFGGRRQLEQLGFQVAAARATLGSLRDASGLARKGLGSEDGSSHYWLVAITADGSPATYGYLSGSGGALGTFELSGLTLPDRVPNAFFSEWAPAEAEALGRPVEGVIRVDASLLTRLLALSGPLSLPENGITASSETPARTLTSVAVIPELIPALVNGISASPAAATGVGAVLDEALAAKRLQVWAANPSLESALEGLLPLDRPGTGNWLKAVPAASGSVSLSVRQDAPLGDGGVIQYVVLDGAGTATLYLPSAALDISGGTPSRHGGYASVAVSLPATVRYRLPDDAPILRRLTVLKAFGRDGDTVAAFGRGARLSSDVVLTR